MAATALGLIIGGLVAAGTANSVIGSAKAAKAARKAGDFEGQLLDEQADFSLARGAEAASRARTGMGQLTGAQRASQAAQGIDITSGSPADVIESDQRLGEFDILTIQQNAEREAHGYHQQAQLARMGGRNAAASSNNQAAGTLLSGAASLFGIYQAFGHNSTPGATPRKRDQYAM